MATVRVASTLPTLLHINCCTDTFFSETDHPWAIYTTGGDQTQYGITGGPPNHYVLWSSTLNGVPVIENCYLGNAPVGSDGTLWVAASGWTPGDMGNWTQTVNFTDVEPPLNACNVAPTSSSSASATFSVEAHVGVTFDSLMDNGAGEFSFSGVSFTYNYAVPYSDWHREIIPSGFWRPLMRNNWSAYFTSPQPPLGVGYDWAAVFGFTDPEGNNIQNDAWSAFQCVGSSPGKDSCVGTDSDSFIAHFRNTRIKVMSNQSSLDGTYTITPVSGNLPPASSNTLNSFYYGMLGAGATYTLTYTPAAGETVSSISAQSCIGGYPVEGNDPNNFSQGSCSSTSNDGPVSQVMESGGRIIFTIYTSSVPPPNSSPSVTSVTVAEPDYCVSGPAAIINWIYSDPDGDTQSAYQVQVDDQGSFQNPEIDSGKVSSSGTSYFASPLQFGVTYKSRVRVWDSQDAVSGWTQSQSWKTPKHAYPSVNFSWLPAKPVIDQQIQFSDLTQFFDGSSQGQRGWSWVFGDGGSSTIQNPTHAYISQGIYNVTETATDKDGFSCSLTKPVGVERPIPIWKEVSPK